MLRCLSNEIRLRETSPSQMGHSIPITSNISLNPHNKYTIVFFKMLRSLIGVCVVTILAISRAHVVYIIYLIGRLHSQERATHGLSIRLFMGYYGGF